MAVSMSIINVSVLIQVPLVTSIQVDFHPSGQETVVTFVLAGRMFHYLIDQIPVPGVWIFSSYHAMSQNATEI